MYSLLRFGGVTVRHNPKELAVIKEKNINEYTSADSKRLLQSITEKPDVIKGTGELYGENCFKMYFELMRMQRKNIISKLCIPEMGIFNAVLTKLSAKAGIHDKLIAVEFEFRSAGERYAKDITREAYTVCANGETLWDISYRCDVPIEALVMLNTGIRNILDIDEGRLVRIR